MKKHFLPNQFQEFYIMILMIASMKWAEHPTTCCPFENSTSRGMIRTLPRGRGRSYHKLPPEHRAAHIQMLTVTSSRCFSRLCLALGLLSITRRPMLSFWIPSCIFLGKLDCTFGTWYDFMLHHFTKRPPWVCDAYYRKYEIFLVPSPPFSFPTASRKHSE